MSAKKFSHCGGVAAPPAWSRGPRAISRTEWFAAMGDVAGSCLKVPALDASKDAA
jgi:hypothetical protein